MYPVVYSERWAWSELHPRVVCRFFCWVKLRFKRERDKVLTTDAILQNFLDFEKILVLSTIFDFHQSYSWIYELNQDLKLFSRFDKLFRSDLYKRYRFWIFFRIRKIFLNCPFSVSVVYNLWGENYSYDSCKNRHFLKV